MKKAIKRAFYPHQDHNPRPLFWHPLSVALFVVGVLFLSGSLLVDKFATSNPDSLLGDIKSGVVIALTNKERSEVGVVELKENQTLNEAATLKAQDMASKGYFAHYTPEGLSPWYWFGQAGYEYVRAGENLAVNFNDSKQVVNAWMNSPTHKANIVKDGYTEIGIGTAEGDYKGRKATFVVQLFAMPQEQPTTGLAFAVEKKVAIADNEQSAVRGAEISVYSAANLFQVFESQTYGMIIVLSLISLIILIAIILVFVKSTYPHTRQFYVSVVILSIALAISLVTEIVFLKDLTVFLQ